MPTVFADTSAFLALLVPEDLHHTNAREALARVEARGDEILTTSYVLIETYALLGSRYGVPWGQRFRDTFGLLVDVAWVDHDLHERGLEDWLRTGLRSSSLVDTVSFAFMEERGLREALAFDGHFTDRGYILPA